MIMKEYEMSELEPVITSVIDAGGTFRLKVSGTSMFPTLIEDRDSVILEKHGELKKKDIVFYKRSNGRYVLHRIVDIKDEKLALCGDNQMEVEYPVEKSQVIAVVKKIVRKGKEFDDKNLFYRIYATVWTKFISARPRILKTFLTVTGKRK